MPGWSILSGGLLSEVFLFAGVVLIGLCLALMLRGRRSGEAAALSPPEARARAAEVDRLGGDLRRTMTELDALARRLSADLDARTERLERLMREVDGKLAELRQRQDTPVTAEPARGAGRAPQPADPPPPALPDDPLARSVYRLADEGAGPDEIARKLQQHIGKVELILALRRV